MVILQNPNTEPYGDVINPNLLWNTKAVMRWDNYIKQYVWDHEETDNTHYVAHIDGHIKVIPVGDCRLCGKKITPYPTKYYQKHSEHCNHYSFLFDAEHYYCEECAKAESSKFYFINLLPREVNRYTTMRDDQLVEVKEYEDGSIVEEMTVRERQINKD